MTTPASVAFDAIRDLLNEQGFVTERDHPLLDDIDNIISKCWADTRREEREAVAKRLDFLAEARMEYVVVKGASEPETSEQITRLPGLGPVLYGEATAARWLARIVRGESDAKGWLPSWRWGEDRG